MNIQIIFDDYSGLEWDGEDISPEIQFNLTENQGTWNEYFNFICFESDGLPSDCSCWNFIFDNEINELTLSGICDGVCYALDFHKKNNP